MDGYIARTSTCGSKVQKLYHHLLSVATKAHQNASFFGAQELAYACGIAHDIGKYSVKFQKRITQGGNKVDHATAGGKWLYETGDKSPITLIAAYCCMGHHGSLPDGGTPRDSSCDATLYGRLAREVEDFSSYKKDNLCTQKLVPPNFKFSDEFGVHFFIRMLYSAIVDADRLDAEAFENDGNHNRGGFANIASLHQLVTQHISQFLHPSEEVSPLNTKRTQLLNSCLNAAKIPSGLFTLTAPTGSGKTKSALAFAFKHAVLHSKRRVIYAAPYNTIIEQNASVFEEILGMENVLRYYGNYYYDDGNEESANKRYSAENWDFPMIATSAVQFFESLFAARASVCRKLHNIAESIIILDEAQMIPIPLLKPCVKALEELVKNYGCTLVLATATQASLDIFMQDITPIEIVKNVAELHKTLQRNKIESISEALADDDLAERLTTHHQVLCIVNTRRHAQELYQRIEGDGVYHLSTTMHPTHRIQVLKEVRNRLENGAVCRVISTSMIEAGVDINFPAVYRAQAGLDSIVQAAGRCNREGRLNAKDAIVYVFTPKEHNPPGSMATNIATSQQIAYNYSDLAAPETITAYFSQLFYNKGPEQLDEKNILPMLAAGIRECSFPFRKVAELFKIIDNSTKTVYALFDKPDLEKRLLKGERSKELFRELAEYAISLYAHTDIKNLDEIGGILRIRGEFDEVLTIVKEYYDPHFGVHLSPMGGKSLMN